MFTIINKVLQETIMLDDEFYKEADENQEKFLQTIGYKTRAQDLPTSYQVDKSILSQSQKDQGSCGSCFQVAAIQSFQERWHLKSGNFLNLSIQYGLGCDRGSYGGVTNNGCKGGNSIISYQFLVKNGTTTEKCIPYSSYSATYPWKDVACQSTCVDGSKPTFYKAKSYRRVSGVANIKKEIYENGPVAASFYIYSDFKKQVANGGIYQQTPGSTRSGGHASVIVGWGKQGDLEYWIVQNTYGPKWNDDGYFKIRMGKNDATIEQFVVCGDPDVQQQNTTTNGQFTNTNYILLNNQKVTLKYQNMNSCTLQFNDKSYGTIQGTGQIQIQLQTTQQVLTAKCGNISGTYKIANFTPQFTNTDLKAQVNENYKFQFLTNTVIQQNLTIGSQTYNVGTSNYYTHKFTTTGQHTVKVYTINTEPVVQDTISITVSGSSSSQSVYAKFVVQPGDLILGNTQETTVAVKGIGKIKGYLYKGNTQVQQFTEIWLQQSSVEKQYQLTVKPTEIGVYYIKVVADDIIIDSQTFTVQNGQQQQQTQIIQPQQNQVQIQNKSVQIVTKYGQGQYVYVNDQQIGRVTDTNEFTISGNYLKLGNNIIKVNNATVNITIIKQPQFEYEQYNGYINQSLVIKVLPNDTDYSQYYNVYVNNTLQSLKNNQITIKQQQIGQFIVKLSSKPNFITEHNIQTQVVINKENTTQNQCVIQIPTNNKYLVNVTYNYTSNCSGQHYLVYQNITKQLNNNKQFKPDKIGNYMICTDAQCSNIIKVYGINIKLNFSNINTINQVAQLDYQLYSDFTDYLYLQYYCKDTNYMQTIYYIQKANNRTINWIMPNVQSCNQAKFRLVNYKYNLYGDSDTVTINSQELPQNSLYNPFEIDPIYNIQPQFNITQDQPPQPPEEEEQEQEEEHEEQKPPVEDVPVGITYPTVNQKIKAGSNVTLKWVSNLSNNLSATIILYKSDGSLVKTFTRDAKNNGQYTVQIPSGISGAHYLYIRVVNGSEKHTDRVDIIIQ